jgi:hypothetical protein
MLSVVTFTTNNPKQSPNSPHLKIAKKTAPYKDYKGEHSEQSYIT